ncbi:MAG: hypothetical protein UY01_C0010G0015 [Candidatus Nomurabacteria bacterium GW2011_GWB1_47_6]|uniref:Uncharacterized protein n=1 Tax=Candidatus Nomurabacteria bacterium GW2011_GWB1_47_6 TaxID=1618749 RepID=A0A0G1VBJ7_9BACT|nr:MAG: hypothetical protein UY01_C0010G0015 [Candidatus Nomurabacteria bacterium GW2011_GWB1_47_6]OHA39448.1 MAG: hypothetical protein A3I98_02715 [Candidatus Taylorbacteria bacterium RIFCSPLOWO2_02_FULL_45_10b]
MPKESILRGNYTVLSPVEVEMDTSASLTQRMQSAAARVLGGSACYVKRKAGQVWPPKKEGESNAE